MPHHVIIHGPINFSIKHCTLQKMNDCQNFKIQELVKHGLNNKCNQSIQHYIANIINSNKYNDSALMVLTPLDTKETQDIFAEHTAHCTLFTEHTVYH